jgi:hypothetical protein
MELNEFEDGLENKKALKVLVFKAFVMNDGV